MCHGSDDCPEFTSMPEWIWTNVTWSNFSFIHTDEESRLFHTQWRTNSTLLFKHPTSCIWLAEKWLKSHNLMTAESEYQRKTVELNTDLIFSSIRFSQCFFKQGPFLGNIDGKPGLLILEKALICSLLALRTLITPIVVLVPLRQEWMSLLCNSFLLPSKWRCSHQKRPDTESETSASRWTTYRLPIYFQLCDFNNLFAWYFSGSVILNFKYTI